MRYNKFDLYKVREKAIRKREQVKAARERYIRMGYEPDEALRKAYHEVNNNL
jgi:hypothetical protein